MIDHAWTVVCDRSVIDQDTGNMSLDTIEQLNLAGPLKDGIYVVPFRLDIVSLWYRQDKERPETAEAIISLVGPTDQNIAQFPLEIAFPQGLRRRTRHILRNLMVTGSGIHHFVVTLTQESRSRQVARVPFEIALQGQPSEGL